MIDRETGEATSVVYPPATTEALLAAAQARLTVLIAAMSEVEQEIREALRLHCDMDSGHWEEFAGEIADQIAALRDTR